MTVRPEFASLEPLLEQLGLSERLRHRTDLIAPGLGDGHGGVAGR